MRWLMGGLLLSLTSVAWAHPGPVDICQGHTVTEDQAVPDLADGRAGVPLEAGEYHVHVAPQEWEAQGLPSLLAYRRAHPQEGDLGSFVIDGRTYDIWQYTRQGHAIIHCVGDDDVLHTGILRMQVGP